MNRKLDGEDAAWLHLDDAKNPMVVSGLLELEQVLPVERAHALVRRLTAYPRFSSRIVEPLLPLGTPSWQTVEGFDAAQNVEHVVLAGKGDGELRAFVGRTLGASLDPRRPLWRVYLVDRPGHGTALLFRVHHALADGYALLGVLATLCVGAGRAIPQPRQRRGARGWLAAANALRRLVTLPHDPTTALQGAIGGDKRVAWSEPLSLSSVKQLAVATSATVNDVLVAAVAGALRRYLARRGEVVADLEIHAMVPVDLRQQGPATDLGNRFGLVLLGLPIGIEDPLARIAAVGRRMRLLKGTPEAVVTRRVLSILGHAPRRLEEAAADFFGAKVSLVLTNMPGPRERLSLSGIPIQRMMFWVPEAAHLGLGISIFSYAGEVTVGALTDASVVADPDLLMAELHAELAAIEAACRAKGRSTKESLAAP